MTDDERLSRFDAGDLPADEAEALRRRLAEEPDLAERLATLQGLHADFEALFAQPVPPELDQRVAVQPIVERPARGYAWAGWALAAALALVLLWPRPQPDVVIAQGSQHLVGQHVVRVGAWRFEVDGVADLMVEPIREVPRVTGRGDPMKHRDSLLAAGLGAVVTIAIYEGTAVAHGPEGSQSLAAGDTLSVGEPAPATPDRPIPPALQPTASADPERIAQLELENAMLRKMLDDLQLETLGTPISWPEDTPEHLRADAFEANVREAIEDCDPGVELLGFECSEPPCFALLRPTESGWWDRLVNTCPAWVDHYSSSVSSASFQVECADGSTESAQMLGWSPHLLGELSPEDLANRSKRLEARRDEVQLSWTCAE